MASMILPLVVFLIAGLVILGLVIAERYPISTWKENLRQLTTVWAQKETPVRLIPQEARLEELMTRDDGDLYVGPDDFPMVVDVVERAMDVAETRTATIRKDLQRRLSEAPHDSHAGVR